MVLEAMKSNIKARTDPVSAEGLFLVGRCLSSPCILTWWKEKGLAVFSSYKDIDPIVGTPPS